jgi:hypothetical protein
MSLSTDWPRCLSQRQGVNGRLDGAPQRALVCLSGLSYQVPPDAAKPCATLRSGSSAFRASRRAEKHAVATHEMFLPQHPELLKHRPRARSYLSALARLPPPRPVPVTTGTSQEADEHFEVLSSVIPGARTRTQHKKRFLYSLSRPTLVACAMSPCRPGRYEAGFAQCYAFWPTGHCS